MNDKKNIYLNYKIFVLNTKTKNSSYVLDNIRKRLF